MFGNTFTIKLYGVMKNKITLLFLRKYNVYRSGIIGRKPIRKRYQKRKFKGPV